MVYPESCRVKHIDHLHGVEILDPYRWLEDLDSKQTLGWIAAQKELSSIYLSQIPAREKIHQWITELWGFEKCSVPIKRGGRYFYTCYDGLQNQGVFYWQESLVGEPHMLLNPNALFDDGKLALAEHTINEDGRFLAYGLSASGSDWQEWHVREVDTGWYVMRTE